MRGLSHQGVDKLPVCLFRHFRSPVILLGFSPIILGLHIGRLLLTLTGPVQAKLMELFPFPYLMAAVNVWQPIKVFITVF